MSFLRLRHYFEFLVVRVFVCIVQSWSLETCARFADGMAWLFADVLHVREGVVEENLARAFPDLTIERRRACRRGMWRHLFLFVAEAANASRQINISTYGRFIDFVDRPAFCRYMFDDRGLVFVTAHFGVFEILGFNSGMTGFPTYSVARTLDNPFLDAFIGRFRGVSGQHLIPKDGAADRLLDVLATGGIVGILADQYAGSRGCWVDFFGHPASTHKAIALLSLTNDVPLVVCSCRRTERPMQFQQRIHGVFDPRTAPPEMQNVKAVTQWFTHEFEQFIRETPEQYWWLHRRWKDNRAARRAAKAESSSAT